MNSRASRVTGALKSAAASLRSLSSGRERFAVVQRRHRLGSSGITRFGLAVVLTGFALLGRWAVEPYVQGQLLYPPLFIAVVSTAFLAGAAPTVLAIVLGYAAEWLLSAPFHKLGPRAASDWPTMASYFAVCLAIAGMSALMSWSRDRAQASAAEAAQRQTELEHEVDERKRAEAKWLLAKKAARVGAWDWNVLTGDLVWTDRFKALFALRRDSAISREVFTATFNTDGRERTERAEKDGLTHRTDYDAEMRVTWPDGSTRWVASHGRAFFDWAGRPLKMTGMLLDITERKRAEEASHAEGRQADALGQFSRELRNPLAAIQTGMDLLDRVPGDSPQAARAREVVRRQTERMARMLDDALDVTRVTEGKICLRRESLNLREAIHQTCADHRSRFDENKVGLQVDLPVRPVWVSADPKRIAQVVGNLLQNANTFTPAGGLVTVRLRAERQAEIRVRDTGIGMRADLIEHLFEPSAQLERSLARTRGGLGLGLTLAKGLVELHGGSIRARSEGVGKGCEFVVTLPLVEPPALAASEAGHRKRPGSIARRVLIIEDNLDAGQTLAAALELEGYEVRLACDGNTGLAMAREMEPDVVLCDIGLPGLDGYGVARALRADGSLSSTRLVALTGYAQPEDKERAREAGFDAHLAKPSPLDEVTSLLA